jgi:hypothetical protein
MDLPIRSAFPLGRVHTVRSARARPGISRSLHFSATAGKAITTTKHKLRLGPVDNREQTALSMTPRRCPGVRLQIVCRVSRSWPPGLPKMWVFIEFDTAARFLDCWSLLALAGCPVRLTAVPPPPKLVP